MRERARTLGGELSVFRNGVQGTLVHLRFPVQATLAEAALRDGTRT
jgi:nitrate/nitrite-specific signal transduction histidine kinase